MADIWEQLGYEIQKRVDQRINERLSSIILGMKARVAQQSVTGVVPTKTITGPNGDSITQAYVWLDLEHQTATTATWITVRRGVTVADGDYIHVVRDTPSSRDWEVANKL